jgi:LPS export ABC transporter protein LptC
MNLKRNFIWLFPLLAMISGPLWWSGAGDLLKPRVDFEEHPAPATEQLQFFVMEDVLLTQNRQGRDEFVLAAARVNSGIHEDVLELEEISARLFDPDGRAALLTGGEAFYHSGRQIITILDNVRLQTVDGQEMKTEALRYLIKFKKVKTAEDIRLTSDKGQVVGGNFSYGLGDGNFRVGGRVMVDLY